MPSKLLLEAFRLHKNKEYTEAQKAYEQIIKINPKHFEALKLLGTLYAQTNNFHSAVITLNKALEINSTSPELLSNYGNSLKELKRFDDAINAYERAIEIKPTFAEPWLNKGVTLDHLKRYDEALASYKKAIELRPDYADAIFNCSVMQLHNLNFREGWKGYEFRWQSSGFDTTPLPTSKPRWQGDKSAHRLLIWSEQGIGDQILYSSLLNELRKFPQKKIITLDKKLIPIFERSFPDYQFVDKNLPISDQIYDEQIPIGSIAQFFRQEVSDFKAASHPYLFDNPALTKKIGSLPPLQDKKICGLSWRSANQKVGQDKSIALDDLLPILKINNFEFVNLQYGNIVEEVTNLKKSYGQSLYSVPEIDIFNDIDGVLSIISACDLIVTTSNTTAHLAGALNKRALLLIPYTVGKFWYWQDMEGTSLWYPSIKVFSQKNQGDWSLPINEIKSFLENQYG